MTRSSLFVRIATIGPLIGVALALATIRLNGSTAVAAQPTAAASYPPSTDGRRITGVVVDEEGRPVQGAIVQSIRYDKADLRATTAADGTFDLVLEGTFAREVDLIAEAEGGVRMGVAKFRESPGMVPLSPLRILLKPSRSVMINVQDAHGVAVPDAVVEVHNYSFHVPGRTAADGVAKMMIPVDSEVRWILAHKGGIGFDYFENYQTKHSENLAPLPAEVSLVLDGATIVRVKAVDSIGQPVAGITFTPWFIGKPGKLEDANVAGCSTLTAVTGADGVAIFDWLPDHVDPGVPFVLHPARYSCPSSPVYEGNKTRDLTAKVLRNVRIGGLVRQADGQPAPGILIQAEGRGETNHYCRKFARTGPDGRYAIDVYPDQKYGIAVCDDSWAAQSLSGILVREDHVQEDLDLKLNRGTTLEGLITQGLNRVPATAVSLSLIQSLAPGPNTSSVSLGKEDDHTLVRFTTSDSQGRYRFRIGPGQYRILAQGLTPQAAELSVDNLDEATVARDFHLANSIPPKMFEGQVVETAAGGNRPLADAMVEVVSPGGRSNFSARADSDGLFRGPRHNDGPLWIYAWSPDGKLAGFTLVPAGINKGIATVAPASKVVGHVIDRAGKPRSDFRVQIILESGQDAATSGRFFRHVRTDDRGIFSLERAVVGSFGEASVSAEDFPRSYAVDVQRFEIKGEDLVELPELTIPSDSSKGPKATVVAVPLGGPLSPTVTSRGEIETLIRAIGRDPATPELIDLAGLRFLPHLTWAYNLTEVKRLTADAGFVGRIDRISQEILGKPADTLTLVEQAAFHHAGRDDSSIIRLLQDRTDARKGDLVTIEGTVDDQKTGQPLSGALIHTVDALTRSDDQGRFALQVRPRTSASFKYWIDAKGFTIREVTYSHPQVDRQAIHLVPEAPFEGQILDFERRPIAGVSLRAWIDRSAVIGHDFDTSKGGANSFILTARTDSEGRFSIPSVPPSKLPVNLEISHPNHLPLNGEYLAPTSENSPLVIQMKPGAQVGGFVVDEQGRSVSGAHVELRQPLVDRATTSGYTDGQGRYLFRNVPPGRWNLVVEPEKLAPVFIPIVADLARPVENQVVAPPGATIRGKVVDTEGKAMPDASVGWIESTTDKAFGLNRMTRTASDGTFKIGPLPAGEFRLTGLAESPRRLGKVTARANQNDALIRLEPAPFVKSPR